MRSGALSFLAGIMLLQQFTALPSYYWCLPVVPALLFFLWRKQVAYWLVFCFLLGVSWALLHAHHGLQHALPKQLISQDVVIKGWVTGIPKQYERNTKFDFIVESLNYNNKHYRSPKHIQLSWYGKSIPELRPGDYWQFTVRLKPPIGTFNPGGFDYEKHLFQKGIGAKGYVRNSKDNQFISDRVDEYDIDRLRQSILHNLKAAVGDKKNAALIYALAIGERSAMSATQWQVLRDTGTAHLMAISGLHIGLIAAIGFWMGRWGWSVCGRAPLIIPAQKVGAGIAILMALLYAFLAGWSIPTQRAFIMVMVVMGGLLLYRHMATSRVLALALFVVLLYDPLSVHSAGLWLSFAAVSIIAYAVTGTGNSSGRLKQWGYIQWSISIGLLPLMLLLFQQVSLVSPVANLWAIPVVSMLVVPLIFLSIPITFISEAASSGLLRFVSSIIDGIWWVLGKMLEWPWSVWYAASPAWWTMIIAIPGVVLLLTPKGFPVKHLWFIFFLPLFLPVSETLKESELKFHLIDVGQGLSAVVQTKEHVLVFDTGPRFNERFDSGNRIILPYLRQQGINKIDVLLVSHEDNDHIGGANAILHNMPVTKVISSNTEEFSHVKNVTGCQSGQSWQWDKVRFDILHPDQSFMKKRGERRQRNNRSCVLRITNGHKSVLLTADIEKQAERRLVEMYGDELASDILVIPHHGSNTSSSAQFIDVINPRWALLPVGYLNRYRLPSKKVTSRYKSKNIPVLSTALEGAMSFKLMKNQPINITRYRRQAKRYWHYPRD